MLAFVGLMVTIPAMVLCLSGLLGLDPPSILSHPVAVLGGLALALAMNVPPVANVSARLQEGSLVGTITIRLKGRFVNVTTIVLSLALFSMIALYLFLENFQAR